MVTQVRRLLMFGSTRETYVSMMISDLMFYDLPTNHSVDGLKPPSNEFWMERWIY